MSDENTGVYEMITEGPNGETSKATADDDYDRGPCTWPDPQAGDDR